MAAVTRITELEQEILNLRSNILLNRISYKKTIMQLEDDFAELEMNVHLKGMDTLRRPMGFRPGQWNRLS